jgi:hypothetical protein
VPAKQTFLARPILSQLTLLTSILLLLADARAGRLLFDQQEVAAT